MNHKTLEKISYAIILLVFISCSISIFKNNIYQDGAWANAQWLGQDIVTLLIAIPLLFLAQYKSIKLKKRKWGMVLSGILFYFVYTYAFYMFAAKLTFLYLFHLPIFSLAIFGLFISLLKNLDADLIIKNKKSGLRKIIIGYLLIISAMLTFIWFADILSHLSIDGYKSETPNGEAPLIIYSLDLALVIPLMVISSIGLWKQKQYGYKFATIMLIKTSLLGFALMAMSISMFIQNLSLDTSQIILWCIIGICGSLISAFHLKHLKLSSQ